MSSSEEEVQHTTEESVREIADEIKSGAAHVKETIKEEVTHLKQAIQEEARETVTHAKDFFAILKENPLYPKVSEVVHWRDPVRSGLIFGIINFFYFLVTYGDYTFLTITSYLLLVLLGACFGYSNYVVLKASWLQGKQVPNPFVSLFENRDFRITRQDAEPHFKTVLDLVNAVVQRFREVFFCTNVLLSLKYAAAFWFSAVLGKWFSEITLLYLVALGAFAWPRLYEEKHTEIDQYVGIAKTQANNYVQLGLSKLPPAVTNKFPALKPKAQ